MNVAEQSASDVWYAGIPGHNSVKRTERSRCTVYCKMLKYSTCGEDLAAVITHRERGQFSDSEAVVLYSAEREFKERKCIGTKGTILEASLAWAPNAPHLCLQSWDIQLGKPDEAAGIGHEATSNSLFACIIDATIGLLISRVDIKALREFCVDSHHLRCAWSPDVRYLLACRSQETRQDAGVLSAAGSFMLADLQANQWYPALIFGATMA